MRMIEGTALYKDSLLLTNCNNPICPVLDHETVTWEMKIDMAITRRKIKWLKSKTTSCCTWKSTTQKAYSVEAVALAKETNTRGDATVEVAYNEHRREKADQQIRGANGIAKRNWVKLLARSCICTWCKLEKAKAAGANFVGEDDLVAKINDGWLDFDVVPHLTWWLLLDVLDVSADPQQRCQTLKLVRGNGCCSWLKSRGQITYRWPCRYRYKRSSVKVSFDWQIGWKLQSFQRCYQKQKPAIQLYVTSLSFDYNSRSWYQVDVNSLWK